MPRDDGGQQDRSQRGVLAPVMKSGSIPMWVRAAVIVGALLTATGAVVALVHPAMLVSPEDEINGAARIYAGYLASRNLALAVMLVALLRLGARRALSNVMVLVAVIQVIDACLDGVEGRWAIVPGVLVFGLIFFVGAARLCGYPFWRAEAWADRQTVPS